MHTNYKKYFFVDNFDTKILDYQDKQTEIIFRNYTENPDNLDQLIHIKNYCKYRRLKFYLSNNFKLAIKLKLDGAYIPSFNKSLRHLNYSLNKDFHILGSAHNLNQIKMKKLQKVRTLFISSLFKKNSNYLGIYRFNNLKNLTKSEVICLGGINLKNIKKIKFLNCRGYAGISLFKKKGPH